MEQQQPLLGQVVRTLRKIRDVTIGEVAEAMENDLRSIGTVNTQRTEVLESADTNQFNEFMMASGLLYGLEPLSSVDLCVLEESGLCVATTGQLFWLGKTLGLSMGNIPWFLGLASRDASIRDPTWNEFQERHNAWHALLRDMETGDEAFERDLPFSEQQIKALYRNTHIVTDSEMRELFLRRFLRTPFPSGRFEIGVIGCTDGGMFPYFMPGTMMLLDRQCDVIASCPAKEGNQTYWCKYQDKHGCYLAVERNGKVGFALPSNPDVCLPRDEVTLVGVPQTAVWQIAELRRRDFFHIDFRDRETQEYVRALRVGGYH